MAKQVFVLTGLLVVLMAAGRAGMSADSSLDGPVIPVPLAEATGQHPDMVSKTQTPADNTAPASTAKPAEMVGTIEIPGTAFRTLYLFQYDSSAAKPGAAPTKDKPLSVVLWKALDVGAKAPVRDVRDRISENSASQSLTSKAVYSLQPDFKLAKLALTNQEIDHVFELLHAGKGDAIAADAAWKNKVATQLKEVEWLDDGSHKNKKNSKDKDKSTKDKSAKTEKSAKPTKATHAEKASAKPSKSSKPAKTATAEASSSGHKRNA